MGSTAYSKNDIDCKDTIGKIGMYTCRFIFIDALGRHTKGKYIGISSKLKEKKIFFLQSGSVANLRREVLPTRHHPKSFAARLFHYEDHTKSHTKMAKQSDTTRHHVSCLDPPDIFIALWHENKSFTVTAGHKREAGTDRCEEDQGARNKSQN